jgi:geranylgeranyl reductase family protein
MMNKYHQYDVTIVGAGPAGSILAYELARQGIKVLVLEKAKLPRNKVCAGGITVRARSLLPFDIDEIVEEVIYGTRLSYQLIPKRVRRYDKPLVYMVMRDKFDHFLVSRAREAGATIEEGVKVQEIFSEQSHVLVRANDDSFSTPIIVGADGANSIVVHSLGLRKGFEYGLCLNCHISVSQEQLQDWDGLVGMDLGIRGGYAWAFPKKGKMAIGAGGSYKASRQLKPYTLNMIRAYNLCNIDGQSIQGHLMPLRKAGTSLTYQRVLLIGDAAGLVDPLSGEGIYNALRSSYLAAAAIKNFVENKAPDLKEYEAAIDREIMPELKISRTIQKMNSITPRIFSQLLSENDRCWRAFCRLLRGEKNYRGMVSSLAPPLRLLFRMF